MPIPVTLRAARQVDVDDILLLAGLASGGLAGHVWAAMAGPGETARDVGRRRMPWRDTVIAEVGGRVAGGLVSFRIASPEPTEGLPPPLRPMQALENLAVGTQHIRILATFPDFRRRGVARALLQEAERIGAGARGLSLIVADRNDAARRLYAGFGFVDQAALPMVKEGWNSPSAAWVLLLKPAAP